MVRIGTESGNWSEISTKDFQEMIAEAVPVLYQELQAKGMGIEELAEVLSMVVGEREGEGEEREDEGGKGEEDGKSGANDNIGSGCSVPHWLGSSWGLLLHHLPPPVLLRVDYGQ